MEHDAAVRTAQEALARADANASYWMQQYKQCVENVRKWVEVAPIEEAESAPRYCLLQQMLQDTRYGLDYAVRSASDARQELANARQFFLAIRTITPEPGTTAPATASLQFRIRPSPSASSSRQLTCTRQSSSPAVGPVRRSRSATSDTGVPVQPNTERQGLTTRIVQMSPLKRAVPENVYIVPVVKRTKYPRAFKWDDNVMHLFPKDFSIPICPLAAMWQYWMCGDEMAKYPPFRILVASELEDPKTKRALSSLRFVMLEIESRVLAQGVWVNNPNPGEATGMLEAVKASLAARPAARRGELQRVEQLQWTSLGRILRDQKKMTQEGEDDEEEFM